MTGDQTTGPSDDDSLGSDRPGPAGGGSAGYEMARRALEEARAAAKASGRAVGQGRTSPQRRTSSRSSRRSWSGPGADSRDPQPFGRLTRDVARSRGWEPRVADGTVMGSWETIVGTDIAAHAQPLQLRDRVLYVSAESTAWATQLRLIQTDILKKVAAAVGEGVVTSLRITGPKAPSWRKGDRHVRGRGPRDTYG